MSEALSPEVEQLARQYVDGQRFTSTNDVILVAMRLFGEFQTQYRSDVAESIQRGFDEIHSGEGIELRDDAALQDFFDDIKRRGRERYEASKGA